MEALHGKVPANGKGRGTRGRRPGATCKAAAPASRKRAAPEDVKAPGDQVVEAGAEAEADGRPVRPRRNAARSARAAIAADAAQQDATTAPTDFFLPVAVKKQKVSRVKQQRAYWTNICRNAIAPCRIPAVE